MQDISRELEQPRSLSQESPVVEELLWEALREAAALTPDNTMTYQFGITHPTELVRTGPFTYAAELYDKKDPGWAAKTGYCMHRKKMSSVVQVWRCRLSRRLQEAELQVGDFEKMRLLGFRIPVFAPALDKEVREDLKHATDVTLRLRIWNAALRRHYIERLEQLLAMPDRYGDVDVDERLTLLLTLVPGHIAGKRSHVPHPIPTPQELCIQLAAGPSGHFEVSGKSLVAMLDVAQILHERAWFETLEEYNAALEAVRVAAEQRDALSRPLLRSLVDDDC